MRSLVLVSLLLAACTDSSGGGIHGSSRTTTLEIPLGGSYQLDVLFVIDNSPAMAGKTERVAGLLTAFANVMSTLAGGVPDLHVGVITTDVGTSGGDGSTGATIGAGGQGGCAGTGDGGNLRSGGALVLGSYLSDRPVETGRDRNYTGEMGAALAQLGSVGTSGCAYARPLEATRRALDQNVRNAGFSRPDAYLAVIHISASDDCSFASSSFLAGATTTETARCQGNGLVETAAFAAQLKATKTDPTKVVVAEITAGNAPRLHAFAAAFPNRSSETALLDSDAADAFALIAQLGKDTLVVPCWQSPLADADAAAPGLQAVCAAELHAATEDIALPSCAPGLETPCYDIVETSACSETGGLSAEVRHVDGFRGPGVTATIECLVEAKP